MGENNWLIEIVVLAMLAGFIALRLVSVLGKRTGHEEPVGDIVRRSPAEALPPAAATSDAPPAPPLDLPADMDAGLREALGAIAAADPGFAPARFTEGAKAAYRIILEAFWQGDNDALREFVSDDVADEFAAAIEARVGEGLRLDNRLVGVDRAEIVSARLRGAMAEISVRFDARLKAATRDRSGAIVAGSPTETVATHDVWTFSRHTGSTDPNWLLIETDTDV
jgi:predicted lipid-binding transport protein (Tim44 family)